MNSITTNFSEERNLILTDSTDKILGVLPCTKEDITERLRCAISEDVCIPQSGVKFRKMVSISDVGATTHLSVEVTDEDLDNDKTVYDFYLCDVLKY